MLVGADPGVLLTVHGGLSWALWDVGYGQEQEQQSPLLRPKKPEQIIANPDKPEKIPDNRADKTLHLPVAQRANPIDKIKSSKPFHRVVRESKSLR